MSTFQTPANMPPTFYPSTPAVPSNQSVVIPQITIPQPIQPFVQNPMPTMQQAIPGVQPLKVKGLDGAKAYLTQPNGMYMLFDEDDDVFYCKITDNNNYPVSLKRYRFVEEEEPTPEPPPEYVTMEEFKKFKEEMLNARQSVRYQSKSNDSDRSANANANTNANAGSSNYAKQQPANSK